MEVLNSNSLQLVGMALVSVSTGNNIITQVELESNPDNKAWTLQEPLIIPLDNNHNGMCSLSFFVGRTYAWQDSPPTIVTVEIKNKNGTTRSFIVPVDNLSFTCVKKDLYLFSNDERIVISSTYAGGEMLSSDEVNRTIIINWNIK